jgi:hypothetical protein
MVSYTKSKSLPSVLFESDLFGYNDSIVLCLLVPSAFFGCILKGLYCSFKAVQ